MGDLQPLAPRRLLDPDALSAAERERFSRAYAERAAELGLTYFSRDGFSPIPAAFPAIVEPRARTLQRAELAHVIVGALVRLSRAIFEGELGAPLAEALLQELTPRERALVQGSFRTLDRLATVRVDLFVDPAGVDRLLEVNATIPAMQGYSDIAAQAFLEVGLEQLGEHAPSDARSTARALLARSGSNADDLLDSLVACYRASGGTNALPSIALVHRPDDAQLGELRYLAARFRSRGHDARTCATSEITLDEAGRARAGELQPELLYRHVFAERVEPGSALDRILREPDRHRLFNPVDPQLEQKSLLAELSALCVEPDRAARLGIDEATCQLTRRHLPWTRRLVAGATTDSSGARLADLLAYARSERERLVVKRSWGFGGKAVFLGARFDDGASRVQELFGSALSWDRFLDRCAEEGGWIVQERVALAPRVLYVGPEAIRTETFVDVSAYTNFGVACAPSGGVCRASRSPIVNIQSGGGVVPLLPLELFG